jgi:truncated hemoglobin YjbI
MSFHEAIKPVFSWRFTLESSNRQLHFLTYYLSALMKAVDAVKSGHLSIRKAAIEFDVPKTTLHDTLKEKYQDAGIHLQS